MIGKCLTLIHIDKGKDALKKLKNSGRKTKILLHLLDLITWKNCDERYLKVHVNWGNDLPIKKTHCIT